MQPSQALARQLPQKAAATTAASGGNREKLLGQRPAGCKRERSSRWEPQPGYEVPIGRPENSELAAESPMWRKRAGLALVDRSYYATRYSAAGGRCGPPCAGFSEKPRGLPGPEKTCRYEQAEDGTLRLTRAFGREAGGRARYSFDFDAPAASAQDDDLHPVCGNFLEEVSLPDSLRVVGSCAFYNCRKLRRLSAGAGELTMGSDVFLNCFALEDLIVRAAPEQPTGLFALVGSITEAVRALFWPVGEASPRAGLWYPAYWEDIEETPAHILLHTFSGQGYHYRQCFLENRLLPAEYDAIFPQGHDADDAAVMAMLCFDRLRWPWQLSSTAQGAYRDFLKANTGRVLTRLLKAQDMEGIKALLALDVMDADAFAEGAALAAKADNAGAAALLADAEHKKRAAAPQKKRYDFDF